MKHKKDAIDNANVIIGEHAKNGLSDDAARKASIVTTQLVVDSVRHGTIIHSLYQRTLNFLKS